MITSIQEKHTYIHTYTYISIYISWINFIIIFLWLIALERITNKKKEKLNICVQRIPRVWNEELLWLKWKTVKFSLWKNKNSWRLLIKHLHFSVWLKQDWKIWRLTLLWRSCDDTWKTNFSKTNKCIGKPILFPSVISREHHILVVTDITTRYNLYLSCWVRGQVKRT